MPTRQTEAAVASAVNPLSKRNFRVRRCRLIGCLSRTSDRVTAGIQRHFAQSPTKGSLRESKINREGAKELMAQTKSKSKAKGKLPWMKEEKRESPKKEKSEQAPSRRKCK